MTSCLGIFPLLFHNVISLHPLYFREMSFTEEESEEADLEKEDRLTL